MPSKINPGSTSLLNHRVLLARGGFYMMRFLPLSLITGILLLSVFLPPHLIDGLPLCLFHEVTGWDCPGCGLTRGFVAMFHGEWRRSIGLNALVIPIAVYLLVYALGQAWAWRKRQAPEWFSPSGSRWVAGLLMFLIFGQWIFKTGLRVWGML